MTTHPNDVTDYPDHSSDDAAAIAAEHAKGGVVVTQLDGGVPIKRWTRGVPVEDSALRQLENLARMPFVHPWVAVMPDVHFGLGATIGCVVPTLGALIPAAVGVDIGCGMMAVQTTLRASDLPDSLARLRAAIEKAVPHGRSAQPRHHAKPRDLGAWNDTPGPVISSWAALEPRFTALVAKQPSLAKANHEKHLGTLGTGNHFIEVCLDEHDTI